MKKTKVFFIMAVVIIMSAMLCGICVYAEPVGTPIYSADDSIVSGNYYLAQDIEGSFQLLYAQNVVIDLNGHNITNENGSAITNWYSTLTINGEGTISGSSAAIDNWAEVTINGGTYEGEYAVSNTGDATCSGKITINDGVFNGTTYSLFNKYGQNAEDNSVTITGGTFNNNIYNQASLTIKDGKFKGLTSSYTKSKKAIINGGQFDGNVVGASNSAKNIQICAGVFNGKVSNPETVTGGTFNGEIEGWEVAAQSWDEQGVPTEISFSESCVNSSRGAISDEYGFIKNSDGTYSLEKKDTVKVSVITADETFGKATKRNYYKSYDNGTYMNIDSVTLLKGAEIRVTSEAVANEGYIFKGWYTNQNGIGDPISNNVKLDYTFNPDSDTTIYAVFENSAEKEAFLANVNVWLGEYDTVDAFEIDNKDEMAYFAYAVGELGKNFSGKTVSLKSGLEYQQTDEFMPVGNKTNAFLGVFDGENNTISGIEITSGYDYVAVFGNAGNGSEIKNLKISNCTFKSYNGGSSYAGGIVAEFGGEITNCSVEKLALRGYYAGGIVGHSYGSTINDVEVNGLSISDSFKAGGIVGYSDNLTINGATVSQLTGDQNAAFGELAGHINAGDTAITSLTVNNNANSVIGTTYASEGTITISDSYITAKSIVNNVDVKTLVLNGGTYAVEYICSDIINDGKIEIKGLESGTDINVSSGKYVENGFAQTDDGGNLILTQQIAGVKITDTDVYIDSSEQGNLRYITQATVSDGDTVEYFGTWFIPSDIFTNENAVKVQIQSTQAPQGDFSYTADLMGIPADQIGRDIVGVSYIKTVNSDRIESDQFVISVEDILQ